MIGGDRAGLRLSLCPLDGPTYRAPDGGVASDRLAAIVELRPLADRLPPEDWLMRLHGLTEAEAVVAARFADGLSPETIAVERGVSLTTVRNQLRTVREKVGAPDRIELMRRLAAFTRG